MVHKILIYTTLLLVIGHVSLAQTGFLEEGIKFDHLGEGLSHQTVTTMTQDKYGFIWIGTGYGLNRFDGVNFKIYEHELGDSTSLGDNYIFHVYEDSYGDLWVGTREGLSRYSWDTDDFTTIRHDPLNPESLSGSSISQIFEDSRGNFWVGTERTGLNLLDRKTGKATRFTHDPNDAKSISSNTITAIFEDLQGRIWIGTRMGGLNLYEAEEGGFRHFRNNDQDSGTISSDDILFSFTSSDGNIWIGTSYGVNLLYMEPTGEVFFRRFLHDDSNSNTLIHNVVPKIAEDDYGNMWLGTENGGLSIYNPQSGVFTHLLYDPVYPSGIRGNSIWFIYKDRDGTMWVCTLNGGLSKFEKTPHKFITVAPNPATTNSLSYDNVSSFLEDSDGGIWIGTDGGGVNYYDKEQKEFIVYKHNPNDPSSLGSDAVVSLYEDSKGRIWVGTWEGGLNLYIPETGNFKRFLHDSKDVNSIASNTVFALMEDTQGRFWVGAYWASLELFDPDREIFTHFPLNRPYSDSHLENAIESIVEDQDGSLWIATWGEGLTRFSWDGKAIELEHFKRDDPLGNSISSNVVMSALRDSYGKLWFGTNGGGLNRYDPITREFELFTKADGLPNDDIYTILEDDFKNLWLSTNKGISKYDQVTRTFKNFDVTDGLQSNQFIRSSGMKSADGTLFFGGIRGFNVFRPEKVKENTRLPVIHVTDFYVHGERVVSAEDMPLKKAIIESNRLDLDYDQSVFEFEFVALNYTESAKNEYAFMLEGYDNDWRYVGSQRNARYTRVPPGNYKFKVKASNNDNLWNEAGTEIIVVIAAPWWRTWWAYSIYALLVGGFLYWARSNIVNRERLKSDLKVEHLELLKMQEMDHMKSRFFANISHEFRTPLSLILGPLRSIYNGTYEGDPKKQFKIMIRNGQRLLQLINQLLDLSKVESGKMSLQVMRVNIIDFLKPILASFVSHAQRQHLKYTTHFNTDDIEAYIDKDKVEKIILNILSNAFKFTPEYGKIEVIVTGLKASKRLENDSVEISVKDTGIGIPTADLDRIFDRFYQVDGSREDKRKGTGIGLSLTKELTELHGGSIEVCSEEGKGTSFTVRIPLSGDHLTNAEIVDAELEKELSEESIGVIDEIIEEDYSPERSLEVNSKIENLQTLLIIEDNDDVRNYLCDQLETNYKVLEADNGNDGFDIGKEELPDLVISDVMMPGLNGIELCKKLKSDERTCHIPVILLTAKADSTNKIEGFEAGADYYVTKPFNSNILELRIRNILKSRDLVKEHYGENRSIELEPKNIKLTSPDELFLKRVLECVEEKMSVSDYSVEDMGRDLGMSRMQLYRKMKALTGQSANEFIRTIRLKRAAQLIEQDHLTIAEVTYEVGFNDLQYFRDCFKKQFGVNPSKYPLGQDG